MDQSTISNKYQVVIPKAARKKLQIKPGQKVRVEVKAKKIIIDTESVVDKYAGSLTGVWGKDPDKYIRRLRDGWVDRSHKS